MVILHWKQAKTCDKKSVFYQSLLNW